MAIRTFQVALTATPVCLGTLFGDDARVGFRQLVFQVEGADAYLGDETVSPTQYGVKAKVTGQSLVSGMLGPFETPVLRLGHLWAVGAGATLHILGVTY